MGIDVEIGPGGGSREPDPRPNGAGHKVSTIMFDPHLYDGLRTTVDSLKTQIRSLAIVAVSLNAATVTAYGGLVSISKTNENMVMARQFFPIVGVAVVYVLMSVYRLRYRELGAYLFEGIQMEKLRNSPLKGTCELAAPTHVYKSGDYFHPSSVDAASIACYFLWLVVMFLEMKGM